jgi:hypothetical protein
MNRPEKCHRTSLRRLHRRRPGSATLVTRAHAKYPTLVVPHRAVNRRSFRVFIDLFPRSTEAARSEGFDTDAQFRPAERRPRRARSRMSLRCINPRSVTVYSPAPDRAQPPCSRELYRSGRVAAQRKPSVPRRAERAPRRVLLRRVERASRAAWLRTGRRSIEGPLPPRNQHKKGRTHPTKSETAATIDRSL